jgi:predicted nucleic acid-binding protein
VIVVDTGPLVALFDPDDRAHARAVSALERVREPLRTTVPVLTEAFHLLGSAGLALRTFIARGGVGVWFLDRARLARAFELMETYASREMDFADGTLIALAEAERTRKIFTIDRRDFGAYRIRIGHRAERPVIIGG